MARAAAKFMEVATDELLTEILLRLPDARSVIRSSLVCKRWNSLLLKGDDDYFKSSFVEFHRNTPKHSELLFNVSKTEEGDFHRIPLTLPAESESESESEAVLYNLTVDNDRVIIQATCGDLVLLSRGGDQLFVYNLLTKQSIALPGIPQLTHLLWRHLNRPLWNSSGSSGYAVASNQISFKVVIVTSADFYPSHNYSFNTLIFNPETSKWKINSFDLPFVHPHPEWNIFLPLRLQIVVVRGVLYWLAGIDKAYGLASVDPFGIVDGSRNVRHLIPLPDRFRSIGVGMQGFKDKFRIGAVCGRLRMSQLTMNSDDDSRYFELLIWELNNNDDSSWVLVHEASLEIDATVSLFFVLAFHPSDKNVIFLVRGGEVFRYNIFRDEYERVSKFPAPNGCELSKKNVAKYLNVLSVVHPTWPTPPTSVLQTYQDEITS